MAYDVGGQREQKPEWRFRTRTAKRPISIPRARTYNIQIGIEQLKEMHGLKLAMVIRRRGGERWLALAEVDGWMDGSGYAHAFGLGHTVSNESDRWRSHEQ